MEFQPPTGGMLTLLMLPENVFDPLLSSLSSVKPSDHQFYVAYEAIPASMASDGRRHFSEPAVQLWYRAGSNVELRHLSERLKVELRYIGHESGDATVGALLSLYTLHPDRGSRPTGVLNEFLQGTVEANVAQFYILSHPPPSGFRAFKIGTFRIGELRVSNLRNRCRNVDSDYFFRYKEDLVGSFTIERDEMPMRLLDWPHFSSVYDLKTKDTQFHAMWNRSAEAYFGSLSKDCFGEFWERFRETQNLTVAAGAPFMDDREMRLMLSGHGVSIFTANQGGWGHVSPNFLGTLIVDFASADRRIPQTIDKLRAEFGVEDVAILASPLKNYVQFLSKAKRYLNEELLDESFLHYVIALELLFGERQRTAESVSRRVAPLVFAPLELSLSEAAKRLNLIYDARSRYVHQGIPVDPKLGIEVARVCDEVLWALLRVLKQNPRQSDLVEQWMRNLDYVYTALVAGKSISPEESRSVGMRPLSTS